VVEHFPDYITKKEVQCKCGCGEMPKLKFVLKIYAARIIAGVPFVFTSFMRCKKYNEKIGGAKNSAHIDGLACDIYCVDSVQRFKIMRALMAVGFQLIEVADQHIHVDDKIRSDDQRIIWGKSK
jgi:uncharacterized protein YcbK (DUF882 family)